MQQEGCRQDRQQHKGVEWIQGERRQHKGVERNQGERRQHQGVERNQYCSVRNEAIALISCPVA